jgi:hypothetical protein
VAHGTLGKHGNRKVRRGGERQVAHESHESHEKGHEGRTLRRRGATEHSEDPKSEEGRAVARWVEEDCLLVGDGGFPATLEILLPVCWDGSASFPGSRSCASRDSWATCLSLPLPPSDFRVFRVFRGPPVRVLRVIRGPTSFLFLSAPSDFRVFRVFRGPPLHEKITPRQ